MLSLVFFILKLHESFNGRFLHFPIVLSPLGCELSAFLEEANSSLYTWISSDFVFSGERVFLVPSAAFKPILQLFRVLERENLPFFI